MNDSKMKDSGWWRMAGKLLGDPVPWDIVEPWEVHGTA